jgi:hypothetical protein
MITLLKAKCKENGSKKVNSCLAYDLFKESTGLDHQIVKTLHPPLQSHLCFTIAACVLKLPPRLKTKNHFISSPLCCSVALTKKYNDAADRWSQDTIKAESVNVCGQ